MSDTLNIPDEEGQYGLKQRVRVVESAITSELYEKKLDLLRAQVKNEINNDPSADTPNIDYNLFANTVKDELCNIFTESIEKIFESHCLSMERERERFHEQLSEQDKINANLEKDLVSLRDRIDKLRDEVGAI